MIDQMMNAACALLAYAKSKKGQSLVEYALILSFISVLTVVIVTVLGVQLRGIFLSIMSALAVARSAI